VAHYAGTTSSLPWESSWDSDSESHGPRFGPRAGGISMTSVAIIHTTQLPLLFISALGFGPRFRPSGFAPPPPQWHPPHPKYPIVRATRVAQLHSIAQHSNYAASCLNCYLLRMQHEAERYLRQKHGGVPHGPRAETEGRNDRIVAKIQTPFRPSERAPFPTPRIFATLCQVSRLGANSF
jgi:hypothetical protein